MNISILGAGAWGTALAISFSGKHNIALWGRDQMQMERIQSTRENKRYLPSISVPDSIKCTDDLNKALQDSDLIISVVPTNALRNTLRLIGKLPADAQVIWACKGFEKSSGKLAHQIAAEELPNSTKQGILSGPSFALEVAQGKPTAITLASKDIGFAQQMANELHSERLRIYSSSDITGVELAGALKNVIAIAAGICDGLSLGNNARAALITRGLAEATRLGIKLGGHPETFMGLAGLGDMILTTTGDLSRNRQVGLALAKGQTIADILEKLGHVAEGVHTAPEVSRIAKNLGVDMPITHTVCAIIEGQISAQSAVDGLMRRAIKSEDIH